MTYGKIDPRIAAAADDAIAEAITRASQDIKALARQFYGHERVVERELADIRRRLDHLEQEGATPVSSA